MEKMFPKKDSLVKKMATSILTIAMLSMSVVVVSAGGSSSAKADEVNTQTTLTVENLKKVDGVENKFDQIKDLSTEQLYKLIQTGSVTFDPNAVPKSILCGRGDCYTRFWSKPNSILAFHIAARDIARAATLVTAGVMGASAVLNVVEAVGCTLLPPPFNLTCLAGIAYEIANQVWEIIDDTKAIFAVTLCLNQYAWGNIDMRAIGAKTMGIARC
jgi:outer membrane murein-binding lipoprotein Lpp